MTTNTTQYTVIEVVGNIRFYVLQKEWVNCCSAPPLRAAQMEGESQRRERSYILTETLENTVDITKLTNKLKYLIGYYSKHLILNIASRS